MLYLVVVNMLNTSSEFYLTKENLIDGTFIRRVNRFVVECFINNKKQFAHLPNPGRLWELLFHGSKLLLYRGNSIDRNLQYTVAAVYKDHNPVLLHTSETNTVAEWLIKNQLIDELKDFQIVSREKVLNHSRIDFHLFNGKQDLFLEVKSCTLFHNKLAMFPDAITQRGTKHLIELAEINSKERSGGILFLIHSKDVRYFLPEYHTDLIFSEKLLELRERLKIFAYAIDWSDQLSISSNSIQRVEIPFDILRQEVNDTGTYILIIYNDKNQRIEIGNLGKIEFKKGYYCYIGSAMQFLSKRVERHKRRTKKVHWHIDYLLSETKIFKTIEIRSQDKLECLVANELTKIADGEIKRFGSSDCNCNSHLLYFRDNPILKKDFIDLILHFRMQRLIDKYKL